MKVNSGTSGRVQDRRWFLRARSGQIDELEAARMISFPFLNGSAFEILMTIFATASVICTSFTKRVEVAENAELVGEQNSEERRKPKKAVVKDAQSIILSCSLNLDERS